MASHNRVPGRCTSGPARRLPDRPSAPQQNGSSEPGRPRPGFFALSRRKPRGPSRPVSTSHSSLDARLPRCAARPHAHPMDDSATPARRGRSSDELEREHRLRAENAAAAALDRLDGDVGAERSTRSSETPPETRSASRSTWTCWCAARAVRPAARGAPRKCFPTHARCGRRSSSPRCSKIRPNWRRSECWRLQRRRVERLAIAGDFARLFADAGAVGRLGAAARAARARRPASSSGPRASTATTSSESSKSPPRTARSGSTR